MKLMKKISAAMALAAATIATPAFATSIDSTDAFNTYYQTVLGWTNGALGTGLAITMLLMGGAMGVAKNSPMPALSGVAGAAFLHWGPQIIQQIMTNGAVF